MNNLPEPIILAITFVLLVFGIGLGLLALLWIGKAIGL